LGPKKLVKHRHNLIDLVDNLRKKIKVRTLRTNRSKFGSNSSCTFRGEFLFSKIIIVGGRTIGNCNNSHGLRTCKLHMTLWHLKTYHMCILKNWLKQKQINFKRLFIIKFIITCNIFFYLKFIISSLLLLSPIMEKKKKSN
jgi:hypothetical protein